MYIYIYNIYIYIYIGFVAPRPGGEVTREPEASCCKVRHRQPLHAQGAAAGIYIYIYIYNIYIYIYIYNIYIYIYIIY